jgi:hypothetical protein
MVIGCLAGSFCFWAPARFRKIATPLSAANTSAQKMSIPRDDRCGCFGNWITEKIRGLSRCNSDLLPQVRSHN